MASAEIINARVVRDVTIVHFLQMMGYKLLSAYFPLFLVTRGFSLPQVGWSYLLIYLPIALLAPFSGFLSRKTNPVYLMMIGVFGYAAYSLGMIFLHQAIFIYLLQVLLGISASLFFTSSRVLLMTYPLKNIEHGFSWFYNAPSWADAVAPVIGGLLIWKTSFEIVFAVSVSIIMLALAFAGIRLLNIKGKTENRQISVKKYLGNWASLLRRINSRRIAPYLAVSLAVLWANGLFGTYFILFLKDTLGWSRNFVIYYTALASAFFALLYIFVIHPRQRNNGKQNIISGAAGAGLFAMAFVVPIPFLAPLSVFALDLAKGIGSFISNVGRSALVTKELKGLTEEAAAFDTIFSPLGIALGALTAGLLINVLGYQQLFLFSGVATLIVALIAAIIKKD